MTSNQRQLSREHELSRRQLCAAKIELELLDRDEIWHPLSNEEYRRVLIASIDELEGTLEAIEREWYG